MDTIGFILHGIKGLLKGFSGPCEPCTWVYGVVTEEVEVDHVSLRSVLV